MSTEIAWDQLTADLIAYAEAPYGSVEDEEVRSTARYHDVEDGQEWMWAQFERRQEATLGTVRINIHPVGQVGCWHINIHGDMEGTVIVLDEEGMDALALFSYFQEMDALFPQNEVFSGVVREAFSIYRGRVIRLSDVERIAEKYGQVAVLMEKSSGPSNKG